MWCGYGLVQENLCISGLRNFFCKLHRVVYTGAHINSVYLKLKIVKLQKNGFKN